MPEVVEDDQSLIDAYNAGDDGAGQQLFIKHHKLILKIIFDVTRGHFFDDDSLQAGAVGLCIACRRFKPEVGVAFTTYAYYWIRKYVLMEVCNEILPAGGIVFGRDMKDKMFKYIGFKTTGYSDVDIALKMKLSPEEVAQIATIVSQASRPLSTSTRTDADRTDEFELAGLPSVASPELELIGHIEDKDYTAKIEALINSIAEPNERYLLNHTLGLNGHNILEKAEMAEGLKLTPRALGDIRRAAYRKLKLALRPDS
jgi:DNA-directed RNA polymerase sigma subunit (sigma70/sigma32)